MVLLLKNMILSKQNFKTAGDESLESSKYYLTLGL